MNECDIGIIGLAVMGQNLVLNINERGFKVCVYNRTVAKVDDFLQNDAKGTQIVGCHSIKEMASHLKIPRKVMLMVKAGPPVDDYIEQLLSVLEKGDIIIEGGNSDYNDSNRRTKYVKEKGLRYVACGVSGGEDGARLGPSMMPGGDYEAWPHVKAILQAMAAKYGNDPCCEWVGEEGSGHFIKMVHNGILYGDMQIISEAYHYMRNILKMNNDEISETLSEWNDGCLSSCLMQLTVDVFKYRDSDGEHLLDKIMDIAGQKGTGKWTTVSALDLGIPLTLIGEAVFSRFLSTLKSERMNASDHLPGPSNGFSINKNKEEIEHVRKALYASKIIVYAQGFMLLKKAAEQYKWSLNLGTIALLWRSGCMIRSGFLGDISNAYVKDVKLPNLLLDDFFSSAIMNCQSSWRKVISNCVLMGIPTPAMNSALAFYDGYRSCWLPANLLQAQRDYFGAHTYELLTEPGSFVHTNWSGHGGNVAATTYNA